MILKDEISAKIKLVADILSLRGSIKTKKRFNIKAMRNSARELVIQRFLKIDRNRK